MNFNERYNEMKKLLIALAAAFSVAATLEAAQAEFSYQGVLKDLNNAAMTGTKTVELRLYNQATGGTALWGRKFSVLLDSNGLFNIEVSDSVGSQISGISSVLANVLAANESLYIGLTIQGTSGEIVPRQKLLPVPFAAVASNVSRASGDFTVSGKLTAKSAAFSGEISASTLNVSESATVGALTTGVATVTGDLTVGGTISGFGTAPIGGIIMWSGAQADIPTGWQLCDGSNGTPDLRGRFVLGAGGKYAVDATGGEEEVTLKLENIPPHTHMYKYGGAGIAGAPTSDNTFYKVKASGSNQAYTEYTGGRNGTTVPHENRPPFWALCFIMRMR